MDVQQYDWIAHHASYAPDSLAQQDLHSGRSFTYLQMHRRVEALAGFLQTDAGVQPGDRVATLCHNSTDNNEIIFAAPRIGAIHLPLNWRLAVPELEFILNDAEPRVLFYSEEFSEQAAELKRRCKIPVTLLKRDGADSDYERAIAANRALGQRHRPRHDDVWVLMYTSGTTGRPKGAMLSHRSLITALLNAIIAYDVRQTDTHLYSFPMCHVAGYLITQHHLMGGSVVLQRAFEAGNWLRNVEKYGCTTGGLAPTMMNFVLQHPKLDEHDTDTMRSLLYGAAAMPVELLKRAIARFGPVVCSGFGMTELGGNVLYHPKADHVRATKGEEHLLAACGIPMAFAAVKVVDENMNECPPREVGEIVVKGEQLLKGYWNRAEATEEAFKGGWFHSGDMAWRDEEGFFYIVDRMKDMIITGGENVYSREVEEVIYVHPGVSEAAIIGLPDEVWGERVVAVVAMKQGVEGGDTVAAEIIKTCRERLAGYKCPKQVFFIGELPKNVSGKILKRELRDQFAG